MTVLFNIFMKQTLANDFGGVTQKYELLVSFKVTNSNQVRFLRCHLFYLTSTKACLRRSDSFFKFILLLSWDIQLNPESLNFHSVKSVHIRSFSGPYSPAFGLNTEIYFLNLRIQSECGKIRTTETPNMDTTHAVFITNNFFLWDPILRKFW